MMKITFKRPVSNNSAPATQCATKSVKTGSPLPSPVWIRLPKSGQKCPHSGMSRTMLNGLCLPCKENGHRPPVASRVLKAKKYAQRGIRLIDYSSLMDYIGNLPTK